ncbi:MAG TPA: hypothetical protein VHE30_03750 [Polyangiaceae bacterium]|nr:hypothetical protein [Polyangiaceae bacterium]
MRRCIHCDRRLHLFSRRVDELYCSEECREAELEEAREREWERALAEEAEYERFEAMLRAEERERLEYAAACLREKSDVILRPDLEQVPCPKCGAGFRLSRGGGSFGRDRGECPGCHFQADFLAIEECPNCRCTSLVVETLDDARCPRCKSRPRRRRQIA